MSERPETEGKKDSGTPASEDRGFMGASVITVVLPDGSAVAIDADHAWWQDTDGRTWHWTGVTDETDEKSQWEDPTTGEHKMGPLVRLDFDS